LVGTVAAVNCLALLEFTPNANLRPNRLLLDFISADEQLMSLPAFVSASLKSAAQRRGIQVIRSFDGTSARGVKENLGTFGELYLLKQYMKTDGHDSVVGITDGHNIGNVKRQADKIGVPNFVIPPDLPHAFDLKALMYLQPWTAMWPAWAITARLRQMLLERNGH
jgi:hypothetical protein